MAVLLAAPARAVAASRSSARAPGAGAREELCDRADASFDDSSAGEPGEPEPSDTSEAFSRCPDEAAVLSVADALDCSDESNSMFRSAVGSCDLPGVVAPVAPPTPTVPLREP